MLLKGAVGIIIMSSFVFCASQARLLSHGVRFIGNSGFILYIIFAATRVSKILSLSPPVNPNNFFLRGPVGHFKPGVLVMGVNTSMSATSADKVTQPVNAAPQPPPLPKPAHFPTQNPPMCDPLVSLIGQPPVTPVNLEHLKFYLQGYDESLADFLISGFKYGFGVNFFGEQSSYESSNLKSAYDHPDVVRAKLRKEIKAGIISGPFTGPAISRFSYFSSWGSSQKNPFRI